MKEEVFKDEQLGEKIEYDAPRIIQKREIVIELQTNFIPDEPPPPL